MIIISAIYREKRKIFLFILLFVFIKCVWFSNYSVVYYSVQNDYNNEIIKYLDRRKSWNVSNLGNIMFLNTNPKSFADLTNTNKTYEILIWKYFNWLQNRHIKQFGSSRTEDPLRNCSVNNCIFTGDDNKIISADAVVVHLQHGLLPPSGNRSTSQRWIFLTDESPTHTFTMSKIKDWTRFVNVFNWSMSYRTNSDIPVPYGRVMPLFSPIENTTITDIIPNWKTKKKDILVTILTSNCVEFRMQYIKELSKYLKVDVYGKCSKEYSKSCPGHFRSDCGPIGDYLFYLVFENSKCKEYITEKVFYNAYGKGSIPIIMGPTVEECEELLPPNSYLHVDKYSSPKYLADDIIKISEDKDTYLSYHQWRRDFEALNEHGYFKTPSKHFCRVCEALNYNDKKIKVYDYNLLGSFLNPNLCR